MRVTSVITTAQFLQPQVGRLLRNVRDKRAQQGEAAEPNPKTPLDVAMAKSKKYASMNHGEVLQDN